MVTCPYCFEQAKLVTGRAIYPHREDLHDKKIWQCKPCDAYVGTHNGTENPLGTLANEELRKLRSLCHRYFDPLWRGKKYTRKKAYRLLQIVMDLPADKAHISMFSEEQCKRFLRVKDAIC